MSRVDRKSQPNAAQINRWRSEIDVLGRNLNRELARLDCGLASGVSFQPVFDRVYLPAAVSLADSLDWLHIDELGMLRLPLWPSLAGTQTRVVLQVLSGIYRLLGPSR